MKFLALLLATALAAALVGTAGAATPTYNNCGVFKKDNPADASDPAADPAPDETEIENAWVQYDTRPTVNIQIKNLSGKVPPPATSVTYNVVFGGVTSGVTNFVRAHVDFTGSPVYEYGHTEPLATSTRYAYDGPTEGELFTGEHGVAQIVIPPEGGGKPGTKLQGLTAQTQLGRTTVVPGAVSQSPSRGLSFQNDDAALGTWTIGPCAPGAAAPPASTPPTTTTTTTTTTQQSAALPVRLASKSIKRAKKGKRVKVKLRSSEPLTSVGVRIAKGSRAYGTGKLAKLGSKGTVKVKLTRALKKGTYSFDVAGTDAQNRRRVGSLKLRVR